MAVPEAEGSLSACQQDRRDRGAARDRALPDRRALSCGDAPARGESGRCAGGREFFFFLRDPASRFVSAFYSRQRQGRPRYYTPWNPEEAEAFARFATPDALARAIGTPEGDAAVRGIGLLRDHYRVWLVDRPTFEARRGDLLLAGFQETPDADFARLRELLGLPATVFLPDDDVQAHRNPAGLDKRLSGEALERLKDWCREDYEWVELVRDSTGKR